MHYTCIRQNFFFKIKINFIGVIMQRMRLTVQFIFPQSLQVQHSMYSNIRVVIIRCFCTVMQIILCAVDERLCVNSFFGSCVQPLLSLRMLGYYLSDSPSSEFDETNQNRCGRSDYDNFDSDICGTKIYTRTCKIQTENGYVKIWDRIIVN